MNKGGVETFEVVSHGVFIEMVNHKPFTTRGSTFHLLSCATDGGFTVGIKNELASGFFLRHQGASERPPRPCGHIGFDVQFFTSGLHIFQHTHPTRGKVGNLVGIVAFHAINRGDFDTTNTCLGVFGKIVIDASRIDCTAQPPPAGVGLGFWIGRNPLLGLGL